MLSKALIVAASLATRAAADCDAEYDKFLAKFPGKPTSPAKKAVFCSNSEEVELHNSANSRFTMGYSELSDWTGEELKVLLGAKESNETLSAFPPFEPRASKVASSADWRSRMPAVKNQGHCGSCWAFSAIAVVDFWGGSHSEQQLVDCTAGSCKGYMSSKALDYLTSHGSETESQYQYMAFKESTCEYKSGGKDVSNVRSLNGAYRIQMAVNEQVVSVSIRLSSKGPFMKYSSGVYDQDCGSGEGHAIAIVGYSDDYWIIRNSWGSSWGVGGHIYFKKGQDLCAVESWAPVTADVLSSRSIQV
jgi:C1A family cysteine protease